MTTMTTRMQQRLSVWRRWLGTAILVGWGAAALGDTLFISATPSPTWGSVSITETNLASTSTPVRIVATPSTGYAFSHWDLQYNVRLLSGTDTNSPTQFFCINVVTGSVGILNAVFTPIYKSLTISLNPPDAGYTSPKAGTTNYLLNSVVAIVANPTNTSPSYIFTGWSGDSTALTPMINVVMDADKSVVANFQARWAITASNYFGPFGPDNIIYALNGTSTNVGVDRSPFDYAGYRYRVNGWRNGSGSVYPPAQSGVSVCTISSVTNRSSLEWIWTPQYPVVIVTNSGGSASLQELSYPGDGNPSDYWVDSNADVSVTLVAANPAQFEPDYVLIGTNKLYVDSNGKVYFTVTNSTVVTPYFRQIQAALLPTWFLQMFKLSSNAGGENNPEGDPDHDGLSNVQEMLLCNTNSGRYFNPCNADTDGDGIDDAYETYSIDPTNVTSQTATGVVRAATDNGSTSIDNGRNGNRDGDYLWDTGDGYEDRNRPLTNIKEWTGPDGTPPYVYVTLTSAMGTNTITTNGVTLSYPFVNNPPDKRPDVKTRVPVPSDTGDQSKANIVDSDNDKFDDGYEYSWDQWQQANGGMQEVFLLGVTNTMAVLITNTVPVWDGVTNVTRRYNPATLHTDPAGAAPDFDVLYSYVSGRASSAWYTDSREYNAWQTNAFNTGIANAPHSIRMDNAPAGDGTAKRCSHPFLKDVDRDGLPDGWEVTFGYDPWAAVTPGHTVLDGFDNPDNDWMARAGTNDDWLAIATTNPLDLRHHEVYLAYGFNPYTGWGPVYPTANQMPGPGSVPSPDTQPYSNIEEARGANGLMATAPGGDDGTSPLSADSDGDGVWDGWEAYVGGSASDGDQLLYVDEFLSFVTSSTNRSDLAALPAWNNKIFPTDPNDPDTDGDGLMDHIERTRFNGGLGLITTNVVFDGTNYVDQIFVSGTWNGTAFTQGGLNPTSSDTDQDAMPDPYESSFASALNGTIRDAFADTDKDKLMNYQEYVSASVYHWHYDVWISGLGSYDAADFFTGIPKPWDWSQAQYIVDAVSCNPGLMDSDNDGMDDYWEVYHGLNPMYGGPDGLDLVGASGADNELSDPRDRPYVVGSPYSDSDGDGLPNLTESINTLYEVLSPTYHTDPTPLWMTDMDAPESWVNLYYTPGSVWYWGAPPTYIFSFEANEGYDTDNDGYSDREELIDTKTDPLTPERPVRRRALYLPPGAGAYARTFPGYVPGSTAGGGGYMPGVSSALYSNEVLRSFTLEAWVRPINPTSGVSQVIIERPLEIPVGNPQVLDTMVLVNFQLGITSDGLPYVGYNGDGYEYQFPFRVAVAPNTAKLAANTWTHLAATYQVAVNTNASQGGKLTLYINGTIVNQQTFSELPVVGRYTLGSPITVYGAPIVVGASDANPNGEISATKIAGGATPPSPDKFFEGWIDEVRIWDGARSPSEIAAGMRTKMKQADVMAYRASTVSLYYLYSFDSLTDPDPGHSPTWPGNGFGDIADALDPLGWAVGFWGASPVRSMVYTDYRFLPWIENAVTHLPEAPAVDVGDPDAVVTVTDTNGNVISSTVPFWNTSNPYGFRYFTAPSAPNEKFEVFNDLLPLGDAQGDEDVPMWDDGSVPTNGLYDTDGDGLPDQWEEVHGLDPLDPDGVNGAYGDPDNDGLNNLAELLAGTDPVIADTDGDGFNDYYSWSGTVYRTFGEIYTDHDGLPDVWEIQYGLDTRMYDAYGVYGDPDNDGWSNYSEYMKNTDPSQLSSSPDPLVNGIIKYNGVMTTGSVIILGYQTNTMDGVPIIGQSGGGVIRSQTEVIGAGDGSTKLYSGRLQHGSIVQGSVRVRRLNPLFITPDFDFTDNADGVWTFFPDYTSSQPAGTNVVFDYGTGAYTFNWPAIGLQGPWAQDTIFIDYQWRDGDPNSFDITGLKEGDLYLFAFRDGNGNGLWDTGEPAGIAESQPIHIGWENVHDVVIGLTDDPPPGHGRFRWPAVSGASSYTVTIRNLSLEGAPQVARTTLRAPTTTFHEGHLDALGIWDLPMSTYQWAALTQTGAFVTNGIFTVTYPASQVKPVLVSPAGSTLYYAQQEFIWTMDKSADRFVIQIARDAGFTDLVYYMVHKAPFREKDGTYWFTLPSFAGDPPFSNGLYYWRIQGQNANVSSPWSDAGTYVINLQPPPVGPAEISGNIVYFGKASGTNDLTRIVVQAYDNGGFGGEPLAQHVYSHVCNTNSLPLYDKGSYELLGLRPGTYFVRIFLDMNANGHADQWESQGFLADTTGRPRGLLLGTHTKALNNDIFIGDRDTDSDGLPDAWEWYFYGNLNKTGYDVVPNSTNTLATKYAESYFDSSPTLMDSDGDGLWDGWHDVNGNGVWDPGEEPGEQGDGIHPQSSYGTVWNNADSDGDGLSDGYELTHGLNPMNAKVDSDGDGMSDANEILYAKTSPWQSADVMRITGIAPRQPGQGLSIAWSGKTGVNYQIQVSDDLKTWRNVTGGAFSDVGPHAYSDDSVTVTTRYYRVLIK